MEIYIYNGFAQRKIPQGWKEMIPSVEPRTFIHGNQHLSYCPLHRKPACWNLIILPGLCIVILVLYKNIWINTCRITFLWIYVKGWKIISITTHPFSKYLGIFFMLQALWQSVVIKLSWDASAAVSSISQSGIIIAYTYGVKIEVRVKDYKRSCWNTAEERIHSFWKDRKWKP